MCLKYTDKAQVYFGFAEVEVGIIPFALGEGYIEDACFGFKCQANAEANIGVRKTGEDCFIARPATISKSK